MMRDYFSKIATLVGCIQELNCKVHEYTKITIIAVILSIPIVDIHSQNTEQLRSPNQHSMHHFEDNAGMLYINRNQNLEFSIFGSGVGKSEKMRSKGKLFEPQLTDGKISFSITNQDGSKSDMEFFADGTAPKTTIEFRNAPTYVLENTRIYGKNLSIILASKDSGSGVAEILWAQGRESFVPYSSELVSFSEDQEVQLFYYAVDNVGNVESVSSKNFVVDVTGPEVSYKIEGARHFQNLSPQAKFELMAKDNSSGVKAIFYRFNDSKTMTFLSHIEVSSLSHGNHKLTAWAVDEVENRGDSVFVTFFVDKQAPEISTSIKGNWFASEGQDFVAEFSQFVIEASDENSGVSGIFYSLGDGVESSYSQPISISGASGTISIAYFAKDIVGNVSEKKIHKVYLDKTPPTVSVRFEGYYSGRENGFTLSPKTKIHLDASDLESGMDNIYYKLGDSKEAIYSDAINLIENGDYDIVFYGVDNVGNRSQKQSLNITIDNQINASNSLQLVEKPVEESVAFYETPQRILSANKPLYLWIGDSENPSDAQFMFSHTVDSTVTFPLQMATNGENILVAKSESVKKILPITIDGNAPRTTRKSENAENFVLDGEDVFAPGVEFILSADDNISGVKQILVSENGGKYQPYSKRLRGYFSETSNILRYYATDLVGNEEALITYTFRIDATPPISKFTLLENFSGNTLSPNSKIEIAASDNISGIKETRVQLNELDYVAYTKPFKLSELGELTEVLNTIYYYSIDNVGNKEQRKSFAFRADKSGPEVSYSWKGNFYKSGEIVFIHPTTKIEFSAKDAEMEVESVFYKSNNSKFILYSSPIEFTGSDSFRLEVYAEDNIGNRGESENIQVKIDGVAPTSKVEMQGNLLKSANQIFLGKGARVTITSTDDKSGVSGIYYTLEDGNAVRYKKDIQFTTSGKKNIHFYAVDHVGNQEIPTQLILTYDQHPPEIELKASNLKALGDGKFEIKLGDILTISAFDRHSEVKSVSYKWDNSDFKTYISPISISAPGTFVLSVLSTDVLDNEIERRFEIEVIP